MNKENVLYVHTMTDYLALNKILPFATAWLDLEGIISEISQTQKYKYHLLLLMCGN
jgi:hypothetical protein